MPLSTDETTNQQAGELVDTLRGMFGTPPDSRPAHAKGQLTKGIFTPSANAHTLSSAPFFKANTTTPLIVRYSNSTGIVNIPDSSPDSNPRGIAIRFQLSDDGHQHYDIIAHSANGFLVRTGEEFLGFLEANKNGTVESFVASHPSVAEFGARKPGFPQSFATEQFFGVNAFKFINAQGEETYFRYRLVPEAGVMHIPQDVVEEKGATYLYEELESHLATSSIKYKLKAQIAQADDVTDDATKIWPEAREFFDLGTIEVKKLWKDAAEDAREQKRIIFDPVPRQIDGVEASNDPLIDLRAAIYLISGKKRREAGGVL